MKKIFLFILITALMLASGCGNSFNKAQEYFTGPVEGVGLKKTTTIVSYGSEQLYAIVVPVKTTNKAVIWESLDPADTTFQTPSSDITVSENGLIASVTPVNHGETKTALIRVTTVEGNFTATCTVTIVEKPIAVTGVTLNKSSSYLLANGNGTAAGTEQLLATISPSDATNRNLIWSSDTPGIAAVDNTGIVTAYNEGSAIITVKTVDGGYSASCKFTVTVSPTPVTGVTLNKESTIVAVGGSEMFFALINPIDATNQNRTWLSSAEAVATVDQSGKVTGIGVGSATITVTAEDTTNGTLSDSAAITVV